MRATFLSLMTGHKLFCKLLSGIEFTGMHWLVVVRMNRPREYCAIVRMAEGASLALECRSGPRGDNGV